ncbi:GTPase Era [Alphaproteobacteria bacterium SO-S41]|nr:GTPase Era [Alphaproteobacteria bacterium SO-S41]
MSDTKTRAGVVAIIGAPNAGKSTLVNRLVGAKVTIVTHKVQTTRMRVRGVMIEGDAQVVLVDTPGIFAPKRRFDKAMVEAAWAGAEDADAIVVIVDAAEMDAKPNGLGAQDTTRIVEGLKGQGRKAVLVLNKVDALKREKLLDLSEGLNKLFAFEETFMVSALKGSGIEKLRTWLAGKTEPGPWLFPEDQTGDISSRLLAAEATREQIYLRLHEELPYSVHVTTEGWEERRDGSVKIDQVIFVERDGQKPIVIGKSGATLKAIGAAARKEISGILDRTVHLFLQVKVKSNWADDRSVYDEIGIEYKK